ncbi:hypothetical protein NQ318_011133, partial [Aromia moschata]
TTYISQNTLCLRTKPLLRPMKWFSLRNADETSTLLKPMCGALFLMENLLDPIVDVKPLSERSNLVFQQDRAAIHSTAEVGEFLQTSVISTKKLKKKILLQKFVNCFVSGCHVVSDVFATEGGYPFKGCHLRGVVYLAHCVELKRNKVLSIDVEVKVVNGGAFSIVSAMSYKSVSPPIRMLIS